VLDKFEIWRQRPWLWILPLAFFLVNGVVFGFYRYAYAGQVDDLRARLETEETTFQRLERDRRVLEGLRQRIEINREQTGELREEFFSTEAERFTRTIARIKSLIADAGLAQPQNYSYPRKLIEDQDLVRHDFVFQVEGTYEQIRRFINFLELTEDFIVLEEISLDESSGNTGSPRLRVAFLLSTVFVDEAGAWEEL